MILFIKKYNINQDLLYTNKLLIGAIFLLVIYICLLFLQILFVTKLAIKIINCCFTNFYIYIIRHIILILNNNIYFIKKQTINFKISYKKLYFIKK